MTTTIPREDFARLFQTFSISAFRLEMLDKYTVPSEEIDYARFLAGEELPKTNETDWARIVRMQISEGKIMQRVHVVSMPLTSYLKFEIDWGYIYNSAAGEQIHLLDRKKVSDDVLRMTDYWLFDRKTLIVMQYDKDGRFLNPVREDSPPVLAACINTADSLLSVATPLKTFLSQIRTV
jgi:hypothetical protein